MDELVIKDAVYNCPDCGSEIEYLSANCNNCGCLLSWDDSMANRLDADDCIVCLGCKREVPSGSRFCSHCGAVVATDGFIDDETERILPKCPQCGERIDYGATYCDACGTEIEWTSGDDLLVDLNAFKEKEIIPRKNKERVPVRYKQCTLQFDTLRGKLNPKCRMLKFSGYYNPPHLQYNSIGIYSG